MTPPLFITTGFPIIDNTVLVLFAIIAIFGGTFVFTECRFWLQSRGSAGRFAGREPLTLPYAVPWLGSAFRMMVPHDVYDYARSRSRDDRPVRLRVGPIGIYILFGSKNVKTVFKNSKVLSKDASSIMLFRNSGMEQSDIDIFSRDKSGTGTVPLMDLPDKHRIHKLAHDIGHSHLASGNAVNLLTTKFIDGFINELNKDRQGQSTTIPFFQFLQKAMFIASTESLAGKQIFSLNPDLLKTYWEYDDVFLLMAIGMPKILYRKGHLARDRILDATKRWIKSAWKNFDEKDKNSDWETHFGSKFIREIAFALSDAGVSQDGQASAMLSLIWAINSNAIPCAAWIFLETLQRPGLLQRLREEVSAVEITDKTGNVSIDVPRLMSQCPLLTSIYLECLRTRNSATITRKVTEDLECDGYILKKGSHIMSPSWVPAHDELWDVPGHPAKSFWPERFIEMPKIKPSNPDEKSQFELAMKPDHFFPYGGGGMICTGRFFAKQEIMAAAALIILKFDIEPLGWVTAEGKSSDRVAMPDESTAGAGILKPDRDIMVKMTRVK